MSSRTSSRPSIPPASPHRAGHYSGLHPEDQPYQSTVIAVQRPITPLQQRARLQQEPEQIILPTAAAVDTPAPVSPVPAPITPLPPPADPYVASFFPQPPYARKPRPQSRLVPILLSISCILLLIGTSLLAFLFLNRKPVAAATPLVTATPGQVRVGDSLLVSGSGFGKDDLLSFTRDSNISIDDSEGKPLQVHSLAGTFSIVILITPDWRIGSHVVYANDETQNSITKSGVITVVPTPSTPPSLRLSQSTIDLGTDVPGATSSKFIILTNTGGGQVKWHSSTQQSWLSVTPSSGTFSGNAVVTLAVNRGNLLPKVVYTGQITFTQDGSSNPSQLLTVTMAVKAPPAAPAPAPSMALSQASLSYSTITAQNPANQTITLQDTSSQPLDWTASAVTGDGASWLSINPGSGHLDANSSVTITVSVQSQTLAAGSYSAIITFTGAGNFQVPVSVTIVAPGNLIVSPSTLPTSVVSGRSTMSNITLQNSGGLPLSWTVSAGSANWLSMTPTHGTIAPNGQANGNININAATLNPGPYSGTLTFSSGSSSKSVSISLTVTPAPIAAISVQPTTLNFTTTAGSNPAPQTFTITDSGTAQLNWSISEDANGTSFAPVSPTTTGSLSPSSKGATITVTPNVLQQGVGTITAHITISDSDKGTTVQSQQVTVTITITSTAVMNLSATSMTFSQDSTITYTQQLIQITNTGSAPLDWSISPSSQPSAGLTLSSASGTIAPGQNAVIYVTCDSSNLSPGTYNAAFVISDPDANSHVASQTVNVSVTVS